MLKTYDRTIRKDSKGFFVQFRNKKIYFRDGYLETPICFNDGCIRDYRAFDGVREGAIVTLAFYTK